MFLRPGHVCKEIYFIDKRCIRTFRVRENGVETTLDFNFEGAFTIVNPSFLAKKISNQYIEAVEKSELLAINYRNFLCLESTIPDFHWSRQIVLIDKTFKIHDELKEMSALERYVWLLKNRPNIIQSLSNDLITR